MKFNSFCALVLMIVMGLGIVAESAYSMEMVRDVWRGWVDGRCPGEWHDEAMDEFLKSQDYHSVIIYLRYYLRFQPRYKTLDWLIAKGNEGHIPCMLMHVYSLRRMLETGIPVNSEVRKNVLSTMLLSLLLTNVDHAVCIKISGDGEGNFVGPFIKTIYKTWLSRMCLDEACPYSEAIAEVKKWVQEHDASSLPSPVWILSCKKAAIYRDLFTISDALRLEAYQRSWELVTQARQELIAHYLEKFDKLAVWGQVLNEFEEGEEEYNVVASSEVPTKSCAWDALVRTQAMERIAACGQVAVQAAQVWSYWPFGGR